MPSATNNTPAVQDDKETRFQERMQKALQNRRSQPTSIKHTGTGYGMGEYLVLFEVIDAILTMLSIPVFLTVSACSYLAFFCVGHGFGLPAFVCLLAKNCYQHPERPFKENRRISAREYKNWEYVRTIPVLADDWSFKMGNVSCVLLGLGFFGCMHTVVQTLIQDPYFVEKDIWTRLQIAAMQTAQFVQTPGASNEHLSQDEMEQQNRMQRGGQPPRSIMCDVDFLTLFHHIEKDNSG